MHRAAQLIRCVVPQCRNRTPGAALAFSSSSRLTVAQPNARLDLDPSLQALLQDVDMALHINSKRSQEPPRELELLPQVFNESTEPHSEDFDHETSEDMARKSPAALFGSQSIGSVVLPLELQNTIQRLINDANKPQLHSDAKRLFHSGEEGEDKWNLHYDKQYRSRIQGVKHAKRDAIAFVSIALPAHYSVIYSVLDHAKQRLGSTWQIERVLDWGAGTGSGLWASLYSFQNPSGSDEEPLISNSSIKSYVGVERRNGLTDIGRRLFDETQVDHITRNWQKNWHAEDNIHFEQGGSTLGLSAFHLSTLPDTIARKKMVEEIWNSGANTIILIDHSSKAGFEAIAGAREHLLKLGREEVDNTSSSLTGAHVVAPCPHDGVCPLYFSGSKKLVCGFSQRLQRPEFVRKTKHFNYGQEDMGYSYVVIRRGPRPQPAATNLGRMGAVAKWALEREVAKVPLRELQLHGESDHSMTEVMPEEDYDAATMLSQLHEENSSPELQEALRLEAYQWPRLVFPPLKKSGHIILDGCTAEGKIMRMTVPKSQGKQAFYDARKSSWGDSFPHPPKSKPQERQDVLKLGSGNVAGSDIGKRSKRDVEPTSYESIAKVLKQEREKSYRESRILSIQ